MASVAISTIDSQIEQLNIQRASEGDIVLNSSDTEILGLFSEPGNPEKRLILLIRLKTPYIDFLGNIKYKIPFYMSSGHYSIGKKGTFQPFFGIFALDYQKKSEKDNILKVLERQLQIPREDALSNNEIYKEFLHKNEWGGTYYKFFTIVNLIKCMYIHALKNNFESEQLKRIITNQTIFSNEYSTIRDANIKLCNPYFEKYSKALGLYFSENIIDIDNINNIDDVRVNDLISINSVFGVNLNTVPTLDIHFSDVMDKIDEYEQVFRILQDQLTPVISKWIKNAIEYFKEGKLFPKETDLLHFYNSYYDVNHEDHEQVLEIIKYNFSQLRSEEREV
jgi:hypothetical protein